MDCNLPALWCECGGTTPPPISATLGHHSHLQSSWRVAQGIACAADHLLVGFRLGAKRSEASLAECAADHRLVEFLLGAVRIEASLAKGSADHRLVELECCATLNAAAEFLVESCLDTAPARFLLKGTSEYGGSAQEGFTCLGTCVTASTLPTDSQSLASSSAAW